MLSLTSLSRGGGLLPRFSSYVVWTTKKVCFSSQPLLEKGKLQAFDEAIMFLQSQGIPPSQLSEKVSFHNGQVDFSKPGFQKLGLQHFIQHRREHLMLFAKQRHVFKDFFPTADLNAEVHLATSHNERIDFCSECPPLKLAQPPRFNLQVYHPEERLYTLLVLDGDYPYEEEKVLREHVLMMSVNQRISASTFSEGTQVHSYIPPHPAKGTGPHRIVTILLEQATTMKVEEEEEGQFLSGVVSPGHTPQPRRDMTVWSWVKHHALIPRGLHLFYAAWDPSVTHTYSTFLNQRAPEYIEVPKPFSPHTLEDGLDIPRFFNI